LTASDLCLPIIPAAGFRWSSGLTTTADALSGSWMKFSLNPQL
jgi:hypothetical protein